LLSSGLRVSQLLAEHNAVRLIDHRLLHGHPDGTVVVLRKHSGW
jgi:hypothetical protein